MFASEHLQKEAVRQKGSNLQFVSEALQADGQVVLEAVQQDGSALQFASKGLQSLRAIVLAAVSQNGSALQFASRDLQSDRQVVLQAVRQQRPALRFAYKDLQRDETIVQEAVQTLQGNSQSQSSSFEMPQRVVLEIRYPGEQTESQDRSSVAFESWPEFNAETEWPKIKQRLQTLR